MHETEKRAYANGIGMVHKRTQA